MVRCEWVLPGRARRKAGRVSLDEDPRSGRGGSRPQPRGGAARPRAHRRGLRRRRRPRGARHRPGPRAHPGRAALSAFPGPFPGDALRRRVQHAGDRPVRVAGLHALGYRRDVFQQRCYQPRHLNDSMEVREKSGSEAESWRRSSRARTPASWVIDTGRLVITAVRGEAVTSKRITENPAKGIRLPAVQEAAEFYVPTRGELEKVAAALPGDWRLLVPLMRGCGLRIGEAFAVSKMSVLGGSLRISEQVLDKPLRLGPLKHRKPGQFRDVPLPQWVACHIDAHIEKHGTTDDGHLFARWSMEPLRQTFMRQAKTAGLPPSFTPHDLRHVFASVALANGVPVTDVSRYLGHRSVDMTYRIYSHFIPSSFQLARNVLDAEWDAAR